MSKIGVHVVLGPRTGYGDFLKKIANAGQTLAVVKCVDDFGAAKEAKDLMSNTDGREAELISQCGRPAVDAGLRRCRRYVPMRGSRRGSS
jgi:hypothetical protein